MLLVVWFGSIGIGWLLLLVFIVFVWFGIDLLCVVVVWFVLFVACFGFGFPSGSCCWLLVTWWMLTVTFRFVAWLTLRLGLLWGLYLASSELGVCLV